MEQIKPEQVLNIADAEERERSLRRQKSGEERATKIIRLREIAFERGVDNVNSLLEKGNLAVRVAVGVMGFDNLKCPEEYMKSAERLAAYFRGKGFDVEIGYVTYHQHGNEKLLEITVSVPGIGPGVEIATHPRLGR